MPSEFYSGTKSGSGGALFVSFNSKDQSVFFRVIKQTGWNDQTSKPTFAGGATFSIKLTSDEVGDFIHAINGHDGCKFYHKFNEDVTVGNFSYYDKEYQGKDGKPHNTRGFGLTVKREKPGNPLLESKIGFSLGSAERLSQYLQFALQRINEAIYAQDKKEAEEYLKKKDATNKPKVVAKKEPPKEVVDDAEPVVDENVNPPEIVEGGEEDNLNW